MIKYDSGFVWDPTHIEKIFHDHKNVNVIGMGLSGNERTKDNEARKRPSGRGKTVNTAQTPGDQQALCIPGAESFKDVLERGFVKPTGKSPY